MSKQKHWTQQLGMMLLNKGALTYIISDGIAEYLNNWKEFSKTNQKVDMIVMYKNHVDVIELKETMAHRRRDISFKQVKRYFRICNESEYSVDFWVYMYWGRYNIVTGIKINHMENLNVFAIDKANGLEFFASIGLDPKERIGQKVDFVWEL